MRGARARNLVCRSEGACTEALVGDHIRWGLSHGTRGKLSLQRCAAALFQFTYSWGLQRGLCDVWIFFIAEALEGIKLYEGINCKSVFSTCSAEVSGERGVQSALFLLFASGKGRGNVPAL